MYCVICVRCVIVQGVYCYMLLYMWSVYTMLHLCCIVCVMCSVLQVCHVLCVSNTCTVWCLQAAEAEEEEAVLSGADDADDPFQYIPDPDTLAARYWGSLLVPQGGDWFPRVLGGDWFPRVLGGDWFPRVLGNWFPRVLGGDWSHRVLGDWLPRVLGDWFPRVLGGDRFPLVLGEPLGKKMVSGPM